MHQPLGDWTRRIAALALGAALLAILAQPAQAGDEQGWRDDGWQGQAASLWLARDDDGDDDDDDGGADDGGDDDGDDDGDDGDDDDGDDG